MIKTRHSYQQRIKNKLHLHVDTHNICLVEYKSSTIETQHMWLLVVDAFGTSRNVHVPGASFDNLETLAHNRS